MQKREQNRSIKITKLKLYQKQVKYTTMQLITIKLKAMNPLFFMFSEVK